MSDRGSTQWSQCHDISLLDIYSVRVLSFICIRFKDVILSHFL